MTSRIKEGRRSAHRAKQTLAAVAAVAFAAALGLARASHPGAAASSGVATSPAPAAVEQESDAFDFGDGSVQSSPGAEPQVQSGVS